MVIRTVDQTLIKMVVPVAVVVTWKTVRPRVVLVQLAKVTMVVLDQHLYHIVHAVPVVVVPVRLVVIQLVVVKRVVMAV